MRKRDGFFSFRAASCLAFLVLLTLAFQNCISPENGDKNRLITKGNGEGYSGKVVYLHYDLTGKCADAGSEVYSQIEVVDGKKYLVVDQCRSIEPRELDVAEIDYLPHNHNSLVFQNKYYQLSSLDSEESLFTEIFCRGRETNRMTGHLQIVDVTIKRNGSSHSGKVDLGLYDQGKMIKSRNTGFIEVHKMTIPDGTSLPAPEAPVEPLPEMPPPTVGDHWVGLMPSEGRMEEIFDLQIVETEAGLSARFQSLLDPELGINNGTEMIHVDKMECSTHGF